MPVCIHPQMFICIIACGELASFLHNTGVFHKLRFISSVGFVVINKRSAYLAGEFWSSPFIFLM